MTMKAIVGAMRRGNWHRAATRNSFGSGIRLITAVIFFDMTFPSEIVISTRLQRGSL